VQVVGSTAALLAALLFVGDRGVAPHFLDDDGAPFSLRFTPLRLHSGASIAPRPDLLPSNRSLAASESLVPVPPWSFPEIMSGMTEPESLLLLDLSFRSETPGD
jgi:hypothetical protein